jgi:UMF1 family MFS transporter
LTATSLDPYKNVSEKDYKRRIWAWTMYDWANSAFATTILAAVLPVYFSQVAGSTLPSATVATAYWSTGLSVSLLIIAVLSPILGTISDIMRGKKRFLAIFVGIGILSTALLVMVQTGDWMLAAIFGIVGRIGFSGANVFYDALLPHVAKDEDQDRVSTRGYAMGYLGGGILLAINIVMIQLLPGTLGPRLSFLSVAIWWAVFSIPLFRTVPEPPAATEKIKGGLHIITLSFKRLWDTLLDIKKYRELFKYLISFLIYNDGIGTIIGVAAIYGAELGFGTIELVLALLLVQFVGIPYSLIFGRLPGRGDSKRPFYMAFIVFNLVALPLLGVASLHTLPETISGAPPAPYQNTATAAGEGLYAANATNIEYIGQWDSKVVSAKDLGTDEDGVIEVSSEPGAQINFAFNGTQVLFQYALGPEGGIWAVNIDDQPYLDPDTGEPMTIDGYNTTVRYQVSQKIKVEEAGEHKLSIINTDQKNPDSGGNLITIQSIEVLPGVRHSNLGMILGMILALELVGLLFSLLFGKLLFSRVADAMDTKRSIMLALTVYGVIAIWGFFLNSVVEFWCLAWMVAVVQGGSQALSRSLYATLSPSSKSGEFFGLFGIMEKFSAVIGPLLFAAAGLIFGSSRPAVLSLIFLFIIGGYLLSRVNVEEGKRVAMEEDASVLGE